MKNFEYKVDNKCILFEYLLEHVNDSKNNIKTYLKNGNVYVNDKSITKYNYELNSGDIVVIKFKSKEIDILYEDKDLIIVNKPSGLLTVSTDKCNNTLYRKVSNYVKESNKNNKIFIVNRLDKDTSGIVVFAKNERVKKILQDNWNDIVRIRKYVAVVNGVTKQKDEIKSYLNEKDTYVYSFKTGKLAITRYEKVKSNDSYSMLNIYLLTGRKNQIRVHMKDINHPVVGDSKYGLKEKCRLMLHCSELEFTLNGKVVNIKCDYPTIFDSLF